MKNKLLVLLICTMAGALVVVTREVFPSIDQGILASQQLEQNKVKKWETLVPYDEAIEQTDPRDRVRRESKNRQYNSHRSDQLLTDEPEGVTYRIDESERPSAIPIFRSAAVILGDVVKVQPYLSDDKKVIYTEFSVRVEEVFKTEMSKSVAAGGIVLVTQEGGALRLRNGRVLRCFVGGASNLPRLNGRYVLFLSFIQDSKDLSILTGYELRDGVVTSLEEGSSRYEKCNESIFLDVVRDAILRGAH